MAGAVKKMVGGDKPKVDRAPTATPTAEPTKRATRGETVAAKQQQAAFRARRGSGSSLISYSRTLGGQSSLQGEDVS